MKTSVSQHACRVLLLPVFLMLACAPGFSGEDGSQPVLIAPNWQCPTPSPIPTWQSGTHPMPTSTEATYVPGQEPRAESIFTTPEPTATPYVRTGSDYFLGQRIQLDTVTIQVTVSRLSPRRRRAWRITW
jgi:hypothetical protein